jgi:hypothetical protein
VALTSIRLLELSASSTTQAYRGRLGRLRSRVSAVASSFSFLNENKQHQDRDSDGDQERNRSANTPLHIVASKHSAHHQTSLVRLYPTKLIRLAISMIDSAAM